jgi:hypothetical protein
MKKAACCHIERFPKAAGVGHFSLISSYNFQRFQEPIHLIWALTAFKNSFVTAQINILN